MSDNWVRADGPDVRFAWVPETLADGRFVRQRVLSGGGQGYILAATDRLTGGTVVIKAMWWTPSTLRDPSAGLRAVKQAHDDLGKGATATRLVSSYVQSVPALIWSFEAPSPTRRHEGVLTGNDAIDYEPFHVYELVGSPAGGETLNLQEVLTRRAAERRRFTEAELLDFAEQLTDILTALHKPRRLDRQSDNRSYFVHNDLKPANILQWGDPVRYVLIDFDAALQVETGRGGRTDAQKWSTPDYAPPAHHGRKEPTDAKFDVYSLGATLYALAALGPPTAELREGLYDTDQKERGKHVQKVTELGYGPILTRVITDSLASHQYRLTSAATVRSELRRARASIELASVIL